MISVRCAASAVAVPMLLALSACATAPPTELPMLPAFDAPAAVAAVRAAGGADAGELDVQPMRDTQVADLRDQAAALEARRMYRAAADLLDQVLAINPDDPGVLQERAETALLLHRLPDAEQFALRAFAAGSKVGPLCRRHWETIAQARAGSPPAAAAGAASTPAASVVEARRQRDACTVAAPNRY